MIKMKRTKIRIWAGTPVHASIDTRLHMRLVELLRPLGIDAKWEGDFSLIDIYKKGKKIKKALVSHHGRTGYRYPYTPAQTDAEALIIDMHAGSLPEGIKMYVTAHRHTTAGTIKHKGIHVIRCPAFVGFIPYKGSLMMMPHFIPDMGAWIVIITKDGRVRLQEWLYKPFLYDEATNEIIMNNNPNKSYVNEKVKTIEEPLVSLLKEAGKVILILADTHVGELNAVCPKSFVDVNGIVRTIKTTPANDKMHEYWQHLAHMTKTHFKPNEIWIVGDAFAGQMPAKFEKYRKITIGNIDDQCYAALELIRQLLP